MVAADPGRGMTWMMVWAGGMMIKEGSMVIFESLCRWQRLRGCLGGPGGEYRVIDGGTSGK